jgi:hypothetical protein
MTFDGNGECKGEAAGDAGSALNQVRPLAFEVGAIADYPLPGNSRANGGRCCPHSFNPELANPAQLKLLTAKRSGLAYRLN